MTSHLLTDGFVSRISFFLPVSPLSPPSLFGSQSKAEMLLYLRRVGLFVRFLSGRRKSVGSGSPSTRRWWRQRRRQQQRRDAGPCGSNRGAGRFVSGRPGVAAVWAVRAEPSTRRDLGWLLWKETRQESEGERPEEEGERH